MDEIFNIYKDKLETAISNLKKRVQNTENIKESLEEIRSELSSLGRENLKNMLNELKSYVEKNNVDFLKNNEEKWKIILDKADALSEYGLYVAPVDLLKDNEDIVKSAYIGVGAFVGSAILTKLFSKKMKIIPSIMASVVGAVGASYLFSIDKDEKLKESLMLYIDDAHEWMNIALENMYKIFKDAQ